MSPNFTRMIMEIFVFAAVNLIFMVALFGYLKAKHAKEKPIDPELIAIFPELATQHTTLDYLKPCFLFATAYFIVFILYHNVGITCENLDKRTQCVCYALEAKYTKKKQSKIDWATKGMQACPDSNWFPEFIKEQS